LTDKLIRPGYNQLGHNRPGQLALHTGDLSLSKPAWGSKRVCQSCGVKFYDFGRTPIICPKCGTQFDPEVLLKSRRPRAGAAAKPVKPVAPVKPKKVEEAEDDVDLETDDDDLADLPDDDEDDDTVIEDTSDLGEDDDEVSKAVVPGGNNED
jgi:uncharacterized protein (TIGR02300 family)